MTIFWRWRENRSRRGPFEVQAGLPAEALAEAGSRWRQVMVILLIEDDKEIVSSLTSSLRERGFVVDVAFDGEVGLDKAKKNNYDIIILDKGLPKKDGLEVCAEIRSAGKQTPILILSVKSEIGIKADFLNAGADDYMTKPFAFPELIARVNALLRRPKEVFHTKFELGDIVADLEGRKVTRGGKEIHLTTKEFSLLEYLLRNRSNAISRMEILEHVWDINADPFTNTVVTHILTLRKKI
ncbi:MAG: response regulator transcription factor, partial [Candidatus Brennerbacteria bacterium]|nr:response regulator transcription factor [Candidatus Brennerbacteria bacterium]